jgi:hypothetical protein
VTALWATLRRVGKCIVKRAAHATIAAMHFGLNGRPLSFRKPTPTVPKFPEEVSKWLISVIFGQGIANDG